MAKNKQVQQLVAVLVGLCVVIMFFGFFPQISNVLGLPSNMFGLGVDPMVPPPPDATDPMFGVPPPPPFQAGDDMGQSERVFINNPEHAIKNRAHTITGSITTPTPCHSLTHEVRVAESFPEQVFIDFSINPPAGDVMCAQVLDDKEFTVTFQADEMAAITIRVDGHPAFLGAE